ncbi:MAG: hypothetical protein FJZ97_03975 [Chloroflexi bacterium]|nr:hypothetical protein [Chloroflexota bacterium]
MRVPTLIAVSTVAWALVIVLHEVVGHVGSAVLLGIPVWAVSTVETWTEPTAGLIGRTFLAASTVLNFVTGGLALLALRSRRVKSAASRYFLWLFATISLMIGAANLIVGGDWRQILAGLEPRGLWRAGIAAVGMLMAVVGYVLPLRRWMPDLRENRRLQLKITAIPVAVWIVVQTLSMIPNPLGALPIVGSVYWNPGTNVNALLVLVQTASTSALWLALVNLVPRPRSAEPAESIRLTRSKTWLASGLIVFVIFVAALGPGFARPEYVSGPTTILSPEEGAAYAAEVDEIVENMLTGLSQNDFAMFGRDIGPRQLAGYEGTFPQFYDENIGVIGTFRSKTLDHVEDRRGMGAARVVIYHAVFENNPDVAISVYFVPSEGNHLIQGLGIHW